MRQQPAVQPTVLVDQIELEHDVVPRRAVAPVEPRRPLRVEVRRHVDAVQPHLVRVRRHAMPQASGGVARRHVDLVPEGVGGGLVAGVAGAGPEVEQVGADAEVVEGDFGREVVVRERAVRGDHGVDLADDVVEERLVGGLVVGQLDAAVEHPVGVVARLADGLGQERGGHPFGVVGGEGGAGQGQQEGEFDHVVDSLNGCALLQERYVGYTSQYL